MFWWRVISSCNGELREVGSKSGFLSEGQVLEEVRLRKSIRSEGRVAAHNFWATLHPAGSPILG